MGMVHSATHHARFGRAAAGSAATGVGDVSQKFPPAKIKKRGGEERGKKGEKEESKNPKPPHVSQLAVEFGVGELGRGRHAERRELRVVPGGRKIGHIIGLKVGLAADEGLGFFSLLFFLFSQFFSFFFHVDPITRTARPTDEAETAEKCARKELKMQRMRKREGERRESGI